MSLKKILLKGTTRMSLHERFSSLRHEPVPHQTVSVQSVHRGLNQPPASARNRKLAQSMDRRPTVIAALRLKKQLLQNRVGRGRLRPGLSVKERLSLRGRLGVRARVGGLRGRIGVGLAARRGTGQSPLNRPQSSSRGIRRNRGQLVRTQSSNNLSRSHSMQSLNSRRGGSRGGGRGLNRYNDRNTSYRQEYRRGGGGRGLRSRGGGQGYRNNRDDFRSRDEYRSNRGGRYNDRPSRSRGFRTRGGGRGGSRGRGGRGGRGPPPSREELDSQLDQYMSNTRGHLDRELDSYMTREETWD